MKKFKMKLSAYYIIILSLALALCLFGLAMNIYNVVAYFGTPKNPIKYYLISAICLCLAVMVIFILVNNKYYIKNENLLVRFGWFLFKISLDSIYEITHFQAKNALTIFYGENSCISPMISPKDYAEFTAVLVKANSKISYTLQP